MWYTNIADRFFELVTKHRVTDGRADGQNYDSQDRASIDASRGNNNHLGIVFVHFTGASIFMIYNGSEFAVFRLF